MGGWGGVNNLPLDIHLHDDLFLLIASTGSRHADALRLIDDVGLGWGDGWGGVLMIHSFIHSFIHFFSRVRRVYSRGSRVHIRVSRAQTRSILRVYIRGKFREYRRGSAPPGLTTTNKNATRGSWPYYQEQERY